MRCLVPISEPSRLDGTTWQRGLLGNTPIRAGGSTKSTSSCQPTRSGADSVVLSSPATTTDSGVLERSKDSSSGRPDVVLSKQQDDVAIQSCPKIHPERHSQCRVPIGAVPTSDPQHMRLGLILATWCESDHLHPPAADTLGRALVARTRPPDPVHPLRHTPNRRLRGGGGGW